MNLKNLSKKIVKVKDDAVHTEDMFKKCLDIFDDYGYNESESWNIDSHDGSSYDGFISFSEGWVEATKSLFYEEWRGGWFKDEKCQKLYESLCDPKYDYETYYEYTEGLKDKYPTFDDFMDAFFEDDELKNDVDEYISESHFEIPAFLKVRLLFNDNTATLGVYLNDDLSYGRERVGAWAGKNIIGEYFGDHTNYKEEFKFENYEQLYEWLPKAIERAQETYTEEE